MSLSEKRLPKPTFYTVHTLAREWGCDAEQILLYFKTGQLRASIQNPGWSIEYGHIEDCETGHRIPADIVRSYGTFLGIAIWSVNELISKGVASDLCFVCSEEYDYATICSHYHPDGIAATLEDVVICPEDIDAFLSKLQEEKGEDSSANASGSLPSNLPKKSLEKLKPKMTSEAMPLWKKYEEDYGCEPTKKETVRLLKEAHPEKYGHRKASSIERTLGLKELLRAYHAYKNS